MTREAEVPASFNQQQEKIPLPLATESEVAAAANAAAAAASNVAESPPEAKLGLGLRQRRGVAAKRFASESPASARPAKKAKASGGGGGGSRVRFVCGAVTPGLAAASMTDLAAYGGETGLEGDAEGVSDEDMTDDFGLSDGDAEEELGQEQAGRGRRRAWQRLKLWRQRAAEEEQRRAEAEARGVAETAADRQRGPPPEPQRGFRLPMVAVPDLLMVWEFTQAFGELLQLPPYSISALEAALDPGPRLPRSAAAAATPTPTATAAADTGGGASATVGQEEVWSPTKQQQQQQQPPQVLAEGQEAAGAEQWPEEGAEQQQQQQQKQANELPEGSKQAGGEAQQQVGVAEPAKQAERAEPAEQAERQDVESEQQPDAAEIPAPLPAKKQKQPAAEQPAAMQQHELLLQQLAQQFEGPQAQQDAAAAAEGEGEAAAAELEQQASQDEDEDEEQASGDEAEEDEDYQEEEEEEEEEEESEEGEDEEARVAYAVARRRRGPAYGAARVKPVICTRRQAAAEQGDDGDSPSVSQAAAQPSPLRFRVSLGRGHGRGGGRHGRGGGRHGRGGGRHGRGGGRHGRGGGARRSSAIGLGRGAGGGMTVTPEQVEHARRLQDKYGLDIEAVRRLVPLDRDYAPSGALLRDISCALLRAAAGRAPGAVAPAATAHQRAARLQNEENENPLPWPERVCNAVWASPEADAADRIAALRLGYGDWADLTAEERVRLLAALVRLALSSEQLQAELNQRLETLAKDGGASDSSSDGEGDGDVAVAVPPASAGCLFAVGGPPVVVASVQATPTASGLLAGGAGGQAAATDAAAMMGRRHGGGSVPRCGSEAPADSACTARSSQQRVQQQQQLPSDALLWPPTPADVSDWVAWMRQRRLGLRRPLGSDLRGRRYWCLGRGAGAFRVYVEEQEGQLWGWYEGDQIPRLVAWLEQAAAACEAPLLRVLRTLPLPHTAPAVGGRAAAVTRRLLAGPELELLRADGYRSLAAPFLRGEWNTSKVGLLAPAEQRIGLAVDAVLGAVPLWFKGPALLEHHLAISEALSGGGGTVDAGRALLSAEALLEGEGALGEVWADVWQLLWRRAVATCLDLRDLLLYTAALQQHVRAAPDLLPRQAFLKYAIEAQCPLTFPFPGDNVAVMRAGLLRHIARYMQLLGLEPGAVVAPGAGGVATAGDAAGGQLATGAELDEQQQHVKQEEGLQEQQRQQQLQPEAEQRQEGDAVKMEVESVDQQQLQLQQAVVGSPPPAVASSEATPATTAATGTGEQDSGSRDEGEEAGSRPVAAPGGGVLPLIPQVQPVHLAELQAQWEGLRQRAAALRPVERYIVRSVVYRRHLADDAQLVQGASDAAAPRWPVAWLILRPAKYGPLHQLPSQDIAVPIAIDNSLPDYLIKAEGYAQRMRVRWQPGDRFRMFFGGKISSKTHKKVKTGGVWYKGTVVELRAAQPGGDAPLGAKEAYDPWESLVVQWDRALPGETELVSPWEVEVDPEEERRRTEEARRQQQAAARAQRARTSAHRVAGGKAGAAEDARAAAVVVQAHRAQQLINYQQQAGPEEESTFNESVYGHPPPSASHYLPQAIAPAPLPLQQQYQSGSGGAGGLLPQLAAPTQPLHPGQEVPPEVLDVLRLLSQDAFLTLLSNFYRGLKGRFKVPIFAHEELDLYTVFWAVMERGGYEVVTAGKQWKEICRCLTVDLTGQTSASFNMRVNYERCLLDFENYLACGQYQRDLSAGCAPEPDFLTDHTKVKFTIPGVDYSAPAPGTRRGKGATAAGAGDDGGGPAISQDSGFGSGSGRTQRLLRGSSRLAGRSTKTAAVAAAGREASSSGLEGHQGDLLASIAAAFGAALPPPPMPLPEPMPVLPVVDAAQGAALAAGWALPPLLAPPLPLQAQTGGVGPLLRVLGALAVGRQVERYWPEEGGWWPALVTAFNEASGEHQLTYSAGQEEESFEWADLGELGSEELRDAAAAGPAQQAAVPADVEEVLTAAAAAIAGGDPIQAGSFGLFEMAAAAGQEQEHDAAAVAVTAATAQPAISPGGFSALLADADMVDAGADVAATPAEQQAPAAEQQQGMAMERPPPKQGQQLEWQRMGRWLGADAAGEQRE